jgi:hypothetical protein
MSSTFLLPFAMGACEGAKGDILIDAFGIVAMVAMTPLIVIQMMGLIYQYRNRQAVAMAQAQATAIGIAASGRKINWGGITVFGEEG